MLYREPKLLKDIIIVLVPHVHHHVSVLYREPKLLKEELLEAILKRFPVSVLYREPKLLKLADLDGAVSACVVSVLYREPKLLKDRLALSEPQTVRVVSVLYREPKLLKANPDGGLRILLNEFQCSTVSRNC